MQGKYTITNVRYRNAVHLPESGEGDDLKVGSRDDQTYIWDIEQLPRNAKYLIKSCAQGRYATAYQIGQSTKAYVSAWDRKAQWVIQPVRSNDDAYLIIADNKNMCWGLEHGLDDASIALLEHEEGTTETNLMWIFEPAIVNDDEPEIDQSVLQANVAKNVNHFLDSIHHRIQLIAMDELATTAGYSVDQDIIRKVIRRLSSTHEVRVKISAARALARISERSNAIRMDTNLKLFAISSLVPLLYSNDIDAISPALTALRAIDESNEAAETAVHKSTVPTLVKLLWLSDITMQINACVLLHKAVENSEAAKEVAINSGAVAALFRLLSSQSKMLQDVATEVLVSITNDWQGPGVTAAIRVVPVADRLELLHSDNSNVAIASCNSLAHNKWERRSEMTAARDQLRTLSTSDVLQVGEAAKKALWAIETELEAINPSNVTPSSITIGFTGNASSDGTAVQSNMNLKLWATNTREYAPGALWISRRADEVLYTDGIVRLETDIDGKKYNCYRVRNSAGRMGLITTWFTISESALNKKVTASITWRDETPGTRWLSIQKGEILFTDGVTQETVENNGEKCMCFRARNAAGRMGFVQTSSIAFEVPLDKKIISKVSCKYDWHGSRWLSLLRGEICYTDGVARQEMGLDGQIHWTYRARNASGQIGFINTSKEASTGVAFWHY